MDIQGFEMGSLFQDIQHFPVGFARSGEFTLQQAEILEQYGKVLQQLEQGVVKAKTKQEKHFVAVCKGKKSAENLLEKSWLKYKQASDYMPCASAFGQLKEQSISVDKENPEMH